MKTRMLSMQQASDIAADVGWTGWARVVIIAIAWAESGGNAYAVNINDADPASPAYMSMDIGLLQINTFWNPTFTIRQALDPAESLRKGWELTKGGWPPDKFNLWTTYKNGLHSRFLGEARRTVGI